MIAVLSMLAAVLVYSFFPLAASIGISDSTPVTFILVSSVFGFGISSLFTAIALRGRKNLSALVRDVSELPTGVLWLAGISGTSANMGNILFVIALGMMSKGGAAIIMESWPIIALFLAPLVIQKTWRKVGILDYLFGLLALCGIVFISLPEASLTAGEFIASPMSLFNGGDFLTYAGIILVFMGSFCFALSGVYRTEFANKLPESFKKSYGGEKYQFTDMVVSEAITKFFYLPIIVVAFFTMELNGTISTPEGFMAAFLVGLIIALVNTLYSYALFKTANPSIQILWYIAPVLAVIWLSLFGLSEINLEIFLGAMLVIIANILVSIKASHQKHPPSKTQEAT